MRTRTDRPSRRPLAAALALLLAALVPSAALAWQPRRSSAELKERSVLVVVVDVLGVARLGKDKDDDSPARYRAWVQVVGSEKGNAEPNSTLLVGWTAANPNRLGSWEPKIYPGDQSRLYLEPIDPAKEPGVWAVVDRSGVVTLRQAPKAQRKLPRRPGQVTLRPAPPKDAEPAGESTTDRSAEAVPKAEEPRDSSRSPETETGDKKPLKSVDSSPTRPEDSLNPKEND